MSARTKIPPPVLLSTTTNDAAYWRFEPGNSTRYDVIIMDCSTMGETALGALGCSQGGYLVTLVSEMRSMVLAADGGYIAPSYIQKKLGVSMADAEMLERLLSKVLGRPPWNTDEDESTEGA